jgi:hypothetical protein
MLTAYIVSVSFLLSNGLCRILLGRNDETETKSDTTDVVCRMLKKAQSETSSTVTQLQVVSHG